MNLAKNKFLSFAAFCFASLALALIPRAAAETNSLPSREFSYPDRIR